jgi:hypothetical protein
MTRSPFRLFEDNNIQVPYKVVLPTLVQLNPTLSEYFSRIENISNIYVFISKSTHSTIVVEQPHVSDPDFAIK